MNSDKRPDSISVGIPVLDAASFLPELARALASQKPAPPDEIILIDSGSRDNTVELAGRHAGMKVVKIAEFSHGGARNTGVHAAKGDIVVLLTQDALPLNDSWLETLVRPLADREVAGTYSRQTPRDNANPMERFFLDFRFPATGAVRRKRPGDTTIGYEDAFFSNVSAAMRRETLLRFPFDENLIMGEDQQFARDALNAGMTIVYQPDSVVIHSHRYSLRQTFKRYFDSVLAFKQIYKGHTLGSSAAMGRKYVRREFGYIVRRHFRILPYYLLYLLAKAAGALAAHSERLLPNWLAARCSMNPGFFRRAERTSNVER